MDSSTTTRTGTRTAYDQDTSAAELESICGGAVRASDRLAAEPRSVRARLLRAAADELERRREEIVTTAGAETAIPADRLEGELNRTCHQLRHFATVVDDGAFLEATIDHARPDLTPAAPDLRRLLVPLGPVAVFGASNFPLAFSTPGGDTASAWAAGCAVVVKVHESHPATSALCHEALVAGAVAAGLPAEVIQLVHGRDAGLALVRHPAIKAVGFTGSLVGGRALMDAAAARPVPIPFYGEMASVNPVVVTPGAARRGSALGREIGGSLVTLAGQMCTKPGVVFLPAGPDGDDVVAGIAEVVTGYVPQRALNPGIARSYRAGHARTTAVEGATVVATGAEAGEEDLQAHLVELDLARVAPATVRENFGPEQLVVRYPDGERLGDAVRRLEPSLTATLHAEPGESAGHPWRDLVRLLEHRSGRLIFNGVPTGVAVTWAQNHGGPYPATNTLHTSVGASAVRRFQRPFTWQNAPADVLPPELLDEPDPGLLRRVDGVLVHPAAG